MNAEGRSGLRDVVFEMTAAAAKVPLLIGITALGAGYVIGRELVRLVSSVLPSSCADLPAHSPPAGRIRESARAAERAARASGLLSPRQRST